MVEIDAQTQVVGKDGPVPFIDLFDGREELLVYKHMFHTGRPIEQQCEAAPSRPGTSRTRRRT